MDREFMGRVLGQVRKRMRTFDIPGYRQSRRVEGMFDRDDEILGFKNLCVYIHTALVGYEKVIAEILSLIDTKIYGQEHYNHTRWLMFFGSSLERLVALGPSTVHQAIQTTTWQGSITKVISDNPTVGAPLIPRLHNPGSYKTHFPGHYDLALFFCKGTEIYTTEEQQKSFVAIRRRALWFYLDDDVKPQMEASVFVPPVVTGCNRQQ